jgi:cardiolipin synthase
MIFVPFFVLLIIYGHPMAATLIFVLAGITDGLDGLIARRLKQKTDLGQFLDPIADKLLLTAAFIVLTIPSVPVPLHIPIWLTVLTISRDLVIALSVLIIHQQTGHSLFPPTLLGKGTTAIQLCLVGTCMMANFTRTFWAAIFTPVVFATLILTLASGFHYACRAIGLITSRQAAESGNDKSRNQSSGG